VGKNNPSIPHSLLHKKKRLRAGATD